MINTPPFPNWTKTSKVIKAGREKSALVQPDPWAGAMKSWVSVLMRKKKGSNPDPPTWPLEPLTDLLGIGHQIVVLSVISRKKRWIKWYFLNKNSGLPVSDPARCVTELALCRLAELRRLESSVLEDCRVKCLPTPRPWWKRPNASTSCSDRRCRDDDIIGPAWPPLSLQLEFNGPWWSICKQKMKRLPFQKSFYRKSHSNWLKVFPYTLG